MDDALRAELDAESVAFEEAMEAAVTASFASQVADAVQRFLAAFVQLAQRAGELTAEVVASLRQLADRLFDIRPDMRAEADRLAFKGFELGVRQAARQHGQEIKVGTSFTDEELIQVIGTLDRRAGLKLAHAREMARTLPLKTVSDATRVTATATGAVNGARRDARWAATRSLSEGTARAAVQVGMRLLWVPERDACLHCLAYAGQVVVPGALFPAGLTFADKPLTLPAVPYPPRHPGCRCRVELYAGPDARNDRSAHDEASVLKREAQRSVARGLSDYASEPARLRAADRLIRRGAFLPPTVIARAARDVRRGKFTARPV